MISTILQTLSDFVFPQKCLTCENNLLFNEEQICLHCASDLPKYQPKSGQVMYGESPINYLFWGKSEVKEASAMYYFTKGEKIQRLLHQIKYKGKQKAAFKIGTEMGRVCKIENDHFSTEIGPNNFDAITFVPTSKKKKRTRGYNQAEELAKGISSVTKVPTHSLLIKNENTDSQTKKNVLDRHKQLAGSFSLSPSHKKSTIRKILLVDDVVTTGATLNECAKILESELSAEVAVFCFAFREV